MFVRFFSLRVAWGSVRLVALSQVGHGPSIMSVKGVAGESSAHG